jgi:membrane fusion protein (multidrug efflux system)
MSPKLPSGALVALPALLFFCACEPTAQTTTTKAPGPVQVQTVLARHGPITRFITLPGEIKPYQEATLYAKVAGYLKTMTVDKGDHVEQGTLLAEIEVPELLADQARYRAELKVAEIDFRRLNESQTKAPDLVIPQTVDDARGKLEVAKANLERTETLLNYARIVAPFSGIITRRMVDPGAFIPAASSGSNPQNAALVTLSDFSRVRLQVAVPEAEAALVTSNQPVKANIEGLPGKMFEGAITRFSYALDEATRTMLAEIELPNPGLQLRPGMFATVRIGIDRKADALLVPVDAVLTDKSGSAVFLVAEGKARKTKVQTGFNDGTNVEVMTGLNADQPVILLGKQPPTDGQGVIVSEPK